LEPNVYYIPPVHVPTAFLRQMFGPGVQEALHTYAGAVLDEDLAAVLCLFGCSEQIMARWRRQGKEVVGFGQDGREIVRVPVREPVHIREAFDQTYQIARVNCP